MKRFFRKGIKKSNVAGKDALQLALVEKHIDRDFYLDAYPDVRKAGVEPAEHYFSVGWREGRDPSPDFQTNYYLQNNPDVANVDICPFVHYLEHGHKEGRHRNLRDQSQKQRQHQHQVTKDVKRVLEFIDAFRGKSEGFDSAAFDKLVLHMFSGDFYGREKGLDRKLSYTELLKEYLLFDFPNGVIPTPFFDAEYYTQKAHGLGLPPIESERSPFRHWLVHGIKNRVVPTLFYSDEAYLDLNPDLVNYPDWLFIHFIKHGVDEGRRFNKLLLLSEDTIKGRLFDNSSRVRELFETLGASDKAEASKKTLAGMNGFLESDLARDLVARASALEPEVGELNDRVLSIVPPWHDVAYCECKTIRDLLPGSEYDNIIFMPFCKLGGADYVAGVLSRAITGEGSGKTLILRTEQSDWARPDWFAEGVDSLDISLQLNTLHHDTAIRALYELVREVGAKNVFNVNSRRCFELFDRFGKQLACFTHLHAYYFCADRTQSGVEVGYPVWFFANILGVLDTALIDNQDLAGTLCARYSLPDAIAQKVQAIYTPAMITIPPQAVAVRQVETSKRRKTPVILWAGRLDRQKRFDLVVGVAKAMPDVQFRCWGRAVLDAPPELDDLPPNIRMEGTFDSFDELPFRESDGWLYTSEWDGLPTILIECAALGVPIVASAVGGVAELITETTGWPVVDAHDVDAYVEALEAMLSDDDERVRRAEALQDLARERHTFEAYRETITRIMEREGK